MLKAVKMPFKKNVKCGARSCWNQRLKVAGAFYAYVTRYVRENTNVHLIPSP